MAVLGGIKTPFLRQTVKAKSAYSILKTIKNELLSFTNKLFSLSSMVSRITSKPKRVSFRSALKIL